MSQDSLHSPKYSKVGGCPDCGAPVSGGREGCQQLWQEFTVQVYSHPQLAASLRLAFDAYCKQHLEPYCRSAKSYAAHLTDLCCGLEYNGSQAVYAAVQK